MKKTFTISLWSWLRLILFQLVSRFDSLHYYSKFDNGQVEIPGQVPLVTFTTPKEKLEHDFIDVPRPTSPIIIEVSEEERKEITRIAKFLLRDYIKYDDPVFISMVFILAYRMMPERIVKILSDFASDFSYNQFGAIVFRGLIEVDQEALGATPETWRKTDFEKIQIYGFVSALMHACVRSFPIQQYYQREGGGFMHSVIPNEMMANTQTGEGSSVVLFVHTEDACLNSAADYLSFLYLRNEEEVPSMLHSIRSHDLCQPYVEDLFKPIFKCPLDGNYSDSDKTSGEKTGPILTNNPVLPFMRFDPAEQLSLQANQTPEAQEAAQKFWTDAQKLIYTGFIPKSGDMIFANNNMVSHGRSPFMAGFKIVNGELVPCQKRWMLRMMSTPDLIGFYKYAHSENPYLGFEKHFDNLFPIKQSNVKS